jgi:hypothetical protein
MNKFKPNYKKKEYDKQKSLIKQQYKGKSTNKEIILRKLETSEEYEDSIDKITNNNYVLSGLELYTNDNTELISKALEQVLALSIEPLEIEEFDKITNYRFYINTPYFDRNGTEPYPLFRLDDLRINTISELVLTNLEILGVQNYNLDLLNIIVRIYRPGDILNFHTDKEIFGDNIYRFV